MDESKWKADAGMNTVFAREPFPDRMQKSIFLAGPTPRGGAGESWRPAALKLLKEQGFDGHVFVPEPRDGKWLENYDAQVEWEEEGLHRADVILFWVPRDPDGSLQGQGAMPAFTTNVEWGMWYDSGKVVFAAPDWAKNTRYLEYYADKFGVPVAKDLEGGLGLCIDTLGAGAEREGGECCIPLFLWKKKEFQAWLKCQKDAGNRLDSARVLWTFFPKPNRAFCYAIHCNVHVTSENRNKVNELFVARPDVSAVVLYNRPQRKVVLVREFRTPVRNEESFIYELPGGSSVNELENPLGVASSEVEEELGLKIDHTRFKRYETRQLLGTLSIHKCALFGCEITDEETAALEADTDPHGNFVTDSELTYVAVRTIDEILEKSLVDWSALGMMLSVIQQEEV